MQRLQGASLVAFIGVGLDRVMCSDSGASHDIASPPQGIGGSGHAVESVDISLGILEDGDETMGRDTHPPLVNLASRRRDPGNHGVQLPFHIKVDHRATRLATISFHLDDCSPDTPVLAVAGEHTHVAGSVVAFLEFFHEDRLIESTGPIEVGDIDFEPIDRVVLHIRDD